MIENLIAEQLLSRILNCVSLEWRPMWDSIRTREQAVEYAERIFNEAVQYPKKAAELVAGASRVMVHVHDNVVTSDPRQQAWYALKAAEFYEKGLHQYRSYLSAKQQAEFQRKIILNIRMAMTDDRAFALQELRTVLVRNERLQTLVLADAVLNDAIQGRRAIQLQELTPVPPVETQSSQRPALSEYDPDYALSHVYHKKAAQFYSQVRRYSEAVRAWDMAVWLFPRFEYRLARCQAELDCTQSHSAAGSCVERVNTELQRLDHEYSHLDKQKRQVDACQRRLRAIRSKPAGESSTCRACQHRRSLDEDLCI